MIRKIVVTIVLLLVVLLFAASLYFLVNRQQHEPEVFETESPRIGTIISKAVATGSIEPRREVAIKPRISGVVEQLYVEAGRRVERNGLIAKIRVVPDAIALNAARARAESARISARNAGLEHDRHRVLFRQQLISKNEYERYRTANELKQEELLGAESNLLLVREGGTGEGGTVSNLIRSTVAGTVLQIPVKQGESVTETNNFNEGSTIATIADMTDLVFTGKVDESEVGRIREGMALQIRIGAIEGEVFEGVLEFISPKGIVTDGAVQFEIRAAIVPVKDKTIRAGYSASADIVLDRRDDVLTLDERALIFSGDDVMVDVLVSEQQVERKKVTTGLSDSIRIEIIDGIDKASVLKVP